jgi:hypothetical protein
LGQSQRGLATITKGSCTELFTGFVDKSDFVAIGKQWFSRKSGVLRILPFMGIVFADEALAPKNSVPPGF